MLGSKNLVREIALFLLCGTLGAFVGWAIVWGVYLGQGATTPAYTMHLTNATYQAQALTPDGKANPGSRAKVALSKQKPPSPHKPAPDNTLERLASLVEVVQPRKGAVYAHRIARCICRCAQESRIDPYWLAATLVVESEFSMQSRPCIGIAQIHPRTAQSTFGESGKDVYSIEGNIWMGAQYLAMHYNSRAAGNLAWRGGTDRRLAHAWSKYNGSSPYGGSVSRAFLVLKRIQEGNPHQWRRTIADCGSLWGTHKLR